LEAALDIFTSIQPVDFSEDEHLVAEALKKGVTGLLIDSDRQGDLHAMKVAFQLKKQHPSCKVGMRFSSAGALSSLQAAGLCGFDFVWGDYLKLAKISGGHFIHETDRIHRVFPGLTIFAPLLATTAAGILSELELANQLGVVLVAEYRETGSSERQEAYPYIVGNASKGFALCADCDSTRALSLGVSASHFFLGRLDGTSLRPYERGAVLRERRILQQH
jgi:hypothetical protein